MSKHAPTNNLFATTYLLLLLLLLLPYIASSSQSVARKDQQVSKGALFTLGLAVATLYVYEYVRTSGHEHSLQGKDFFLDKKVGRQT